MKYCKRPERPRPKGKRSRQDFKSATAHAQLRLKDSLSKETYNKQETRWTSPSKETASSKIQQPSGDIAYTRAGHSKKIAKGGW
jgi:hypothetical protein